MKRLLITLTLSLLAVATVVLWRGWPRLFPSSEVSDLYRRYEHNDHIRATEIHDFQVNDTLAVATVLLQATTDSAWYALLTDFGMPEELIDFYKSDRDFLERDNANSILYFYVEKNNPQKRTLQTNPNSMFVVGSLIKKTICIFMTDDKTTKKIASFNEIKKLKL